MNAFKSQFLLLWRTRRVHALLATVLLCGGLQFWTSWEFSRGFRLHPEDLAGEYGTLFMITANMFLHMLTAVAALWGVVVWRVEGPSHRTYHFSLPVALRTHDLLRVAAGAAWLLLVSFVVAILAFGILLTTRAGDQASMTVTFWLSFVTVTMVPYLLSSALGLASDRASEWLLGGYVVVTFLGVFATSRRDASYPLLRDFFFGPVGIARALSGGSSVRPSSGDRNWARYDLANEHLWWLATCVWVVLSLVVALGAAYAIHRRRTLPHPVMAIAQ